LKKKEEEEQLPKNHQLEKQLEEKVLLLQLWTL
jgi:hypothetical protein